jgi:hypothetical protein
MGEEIKTADALLVEQVARIIDPGSWRVMDSYRERVMRHNPDYNHDDFKPKASIALARQILALPALQSENTRLLGEDQGSASPQSDTIEPRGSLPANDGCDWPPGVAFGFHDDPGEHDPCYVIMPGGAMLEFNHSATPGVDIARASFVQAACNLALERKSIGPLDVVADLRAVLDQVDGACEAMADEGLLAEGSWRYVNDAIARADSYLIDPRWAQASICLYQAGYPDLGEFIDASLSSEAPPVSPSEASAATGSMQMNPSSAAPKPEPVLSEVDWVLVPREPTEAMIEAYCRKLHDLGFISWVNASTIWPVLIAAAPENLPAPPLPVEEGWQPYAASDEEEHPLKDVSIPREAGSGEAQVDASRGAK